MRKKGPLQRTVPHVAFVMSVLATVAVGGAQPNGVVLGSTLGALLGVPLGTLLGNSDASRLGARLAAMEGAFDGQ